MRGRLHLALAVAGILGLPCPAAPQDSNILLPVDSVERWLAHRPFEVQSREDSRFVGDRTQRVVLVFPDSSAMMVKWAKAARGGEAFNNQPRYEIAAYRLQSLFLDPGEYVVPPTVARAVPLAYYRQFEPSVSPTFGGTESVLVVLQYWLYQVTSRDVFDEERFSRDTAYARALGNLNLLTYLIRHNDANLGNVLISTDSLRPRLFTVDNGVAFGPEESDRGFVWRNLRVNRVPRAAVDRLRQLRREDLDRVLGVVAQFEVRDGQLVPVEPTENLSRGRGVRRGESVIQLGLTSQEIGGVYGRVQRLLRQVDAGRIQTFE